jgi:peptidoglycan/LPS O-acetylase OafA/YrhL
VPCDNAEWPGRTSLKKSSGNLIAIQILRCLAALLVVVWHSHLSIKLFAHDYWPEDGDFIFRASHYPFWASHLAAGVDIFFCISGFIMSMLAVRTSRASAGAFIIDRFARILPPYWFFTTVVIAVYLFNPRFNIGGLTGDFRQDVSLVVKSFLLVPQDKGPVLGPGWTLIHEFLFYYLVAIIIFLKQGQRMVLILAAIAGVGVALSFGGVTILDGYGLSPFYAEFFAGALAYRVHHKTSSFFPEAQCAIAIALYFGISALIDIFLLPSYIQVFGFGLMGFILISGMIGIDAKYDLKRFSPTRLFARIGDASYSLYLSHWFVLSLIGKFAALVPGAPFPFVVIWQIAAIASAVFFAVLFAEHIELPFHRVLLNRLKSHRAVVVSKDKAEIEKTPGLAPPFV